MAILNWNAFKYKYNDRESKSFEMLAYELFCFEHDQSNGIFRFKNQHGIETEPIMVKGELIGFQAKYYETKISDNKKDIMDSLQKAKSKNQNINKVYLYLNQEFSESKDNGVKNPKYKTEIENFAAKLDITIIWQVPSHFEIILSKPLSKEIREYYFPEYNASGKEKKTIPKALTNNIPLLSKVFIMYSWDSEDHKDRVLSLWQTLRENGFDAVFDRQVSQENSAADFNVMMHRAITDYHKVVIVLSDGYAKKANAFKGGVGFEYSMLIKDIQEYHQKYILVTFDEIKNGIFPAYLKGRDVTRLSDEADLKTLYRKLMDVPEFQIPEVSTSKPDLRTKEIAPLFSKEGLFVSEIKVKSDAGSWQSGSLYVRHVQAISVVVTNNSTKTIEGFKLKVEIPSNLTKYDPKAEILNNNRVFSIQNDQKLYSDDSAEIQCGETYIHYKDAEQAFNSEITVKILWDGGKTESTHPIDGFLLGTTMYGERKVLQLSDFHDKSADIR